MTNTDPTATTPPRLAGTGIWSHGIRYGDPGRARDRAAEVEALGYSAIWLPDVGGDLFGSVANVLGATQRAVVATGVLNLWMHPAPDVAAWVAGLDDHARHRLLLGIGVSHRMLIDAGDPGRYRKPLSAMRAYLDELDAAPRPVPRHRRVLAALGPKMLALAATRSAGVHPYFVTTDHVRIARDAVGRDALVASEQAVVLESSPTTARELARGHMSTYLALPNYTNNLLRLGFDESDLAGGGSDRLVDAVVVWGDEATIAARVAEHRDAGADHVCVQVIAPDGAAISDAWRHLAPALV